jgi:hypothetical protein
VPAQTIGFFRFCLDELLAAAYLPPCTHARMVMFPELWTTGRVSSASTAHFVFTPVEHGQGFS